MPFTVTDQIGYFSSDFFNHIVLSCVETPRSSTSLTDIGTIVETSATSDALKFDDFYEAAKTIADEYRSDAIYVLRGLEANSNVLHLSQFDSIVVNFAGIPVFRVKLTNNHSMRSVTVDIVAVRNAMSTSNVHRFTMKNFLFSVSIEVTTLLLTSATIAAISTFFKSLKR